MAYGFDEYKNKVEVYPASEVYTKDEVYSKNEIDDLFVIENIEWKNVTLPPTSIFDQNKVVTKQGYKLLGVVGFGADYGSGRDYIQYTNYTPIHGQSDDVIQLKIYNNYHTEFTADFYFTCLYVKVEE